MKKRIENFLSFLKSIIVNLRLFGLRKGIKMPVLISYDTKIGDLYRNSIKIENLSFGAVKIGINSGSEGVPVYDNGFLSIGKNSQIIFRGKANFASGTRIILSGSGRMIVGDEFSSNRNCTFACDKEIIIGNNVLFGWNVNLRTSDGHNIYMFNDTDKQILNIAESIYIEDHCWICANVDILKGAKIARNVIVAYNATVLGKCNEENCIIGGFPAKVIKSHVKWER